MATKARKLSSKPKAPGIVFHFVGSLILLYASCLVYSPNGMGGMLFVTYGGRSNYLTLWGLAFSLFAFISKLLVDILPTISALQDVKMLLMLISLPIESSITLLYWSLVLAKPELMMPPGVDLMMLFPRSTDLALHLYPVILLWIDHLFFSPPLTQRSTHSCKLTNGKTFNPIYIIIGFGWAYTSWIEFTTAKEGKNLFPYPFLNVMPLLARYSLYLVTVLITNGFLKLAESLHKRLIPQAIQ